MIFDILYREENKSTMPRNFELKNGNCYRLHIGKYKEVTVPKECERYNIRLNVHGENLLQSKSHVIQYHQIMKSLATETLGLKKFNCDFDNLDQLVKKIAHISFDDKIQFNGDSNLLQCIDEASAGGCLIAKAGKYDGEFSCYDINNSYNDFFVNYDDIPTNPTFQTVSKIIKDKTFALYKLKIIDEEYISKKEHTMKFKTNRQTQWFTSQDIKIFKLYDIKYKLIKEENNCIVYDTVKCDFEWMKKVNALKQKTNKQTDVIKYNIYKQFLSSFWGQCSAYNTVEFPEGVKANLSSDWFYKTRPSDACKIYINPDKIFKYSCGILKPFVLSWARLRLLKQIKKVEDSGKKVVYAHTDSIICEKCDDLFKLGTNIGNWKLENTGNIEIKNIGNKQFF